MHLSGDYDSFATPLLWKEIEGFLQGDGEGLILDASEVTIFAASAIRVLMMTAENLQPRHKSLRFVRQAQLAP